MRMFLLFGFYSLLAQVLLLREIAQVFTAHELSLAAALACWLLWTAAGARLGARAAEAGAFGRGCLVFAAAAPLNLVLARLAPGLLPGLSQPGLFTILAGAALLCLPAGLANGYAAGAALRGAPALFYAAEAAGAAAAGLFTVLYFRYFPGVEAAAALAAPALVLCAAYTLAKPFSFRRFAAAGAACLGLVSADLAAPHAWTLKPPAPKPGIVIQTEGSRLALAGHGELSFYEDGRLAYAPEAAGPEELVHLPLLTLKHPEKVLLHGGGAFFALPEVLKHRPEAVEIAEPDPFKARWLAGHTRADEKSFTLLRADPRGLKNRREYYSAIFNAEGAPENAAQNRLFTLEYFRTAAAMLKPGGLLVFQLPFAENYVPPATAYAAACVLASARTVFSVVEIIPGARLTVLASTKKIDLDPAYLAAAYARRGLKTRTVVSSSFPFMLDPYRRAWASGEIEKIKKPPLNTDLNPLAYFRFWRAWLSMVMSPASFLGLAALTGAGLFAAYRLKGALRFTPEERTGEAFLMGFWGLAFETAVLLTFQARTGRLSPELGAMFALFMAGAAGGAWAAKGCHAKFILLSEAAAAALALACALKPELAQAAVAVRLLVLSGGFLSGAFFAAAAAKNGGEVYTWDLVGGAAGGLAIAAFAAPITGISGALYFSGLAALGALAGGLFSSSSKESTVKE
jgi:spermidine synthase